jgi:hypothetical protein
MQVCAVKDATDEEILLVCNEENPSGTTCGWVRVIREDIEGNPNPTGPTQCTKFKGRVHFLVGC